MEYRFNILLVEDNDGDIRLLKELLNEQTFFKYTLSLAGSVGELEEKLTEDSCDIILLDLGLPDSTGLETFSRVKSFCPSEVSIIIFTGLNDIETGLAAVNRGAQDYLVKGRIDSDTLVKSIIYAYERNRLKNEFNLQLIAKQKAEEELFKSKERLDLIANRTSAVMYQTGKDGISFEYLHNAFESLSGYTIDEIKNIGFESIIKEAVKIGGANINKEKLADIWSEKIKREVAVEYLIQTRQGELKWISDKSYPLDDEKSNGGAIGILMDISASKEAEIEITAQKNKSDQLFSNSPVAVVHLDTNGMILNVNGSFERIFGYRASDIIGVNLDELIVPHELLEEAISYNSETLGGKAISEVTYRQRKNDSIVYVSVAGVPIKVKGEVVGCYAMYIDLTKQKLAEEALVKARDKARESDRLKTAFLHNISHEIRTPMNAIVGFSALLGETDQPEEVRKSFIETINSSSNHLLSIINDIVEISNIEANLVKVIKSEVDVEALLKEISATFIKEAQRKNLSLQVKASQHDRPLCILTDKTKLYQVMSNLVSNALKFSDKGKVEMGFITRDSVLEFFVSDNGIGIPADKLEQIFDRFFQVDHSETRAYEGTGLGLSISKSYVELLGGNIWAESVPGEGSILHFTLPLDMIEKCEEKPVENFNNQESGETPRKTILVAEDVESNFRLIEHYLSEISADIIWAMNGKEALETFEGNGGVDLILMDIKMPVMDGYEAMKCIRETDKEVPIIAQTAFIDDLDKAYECGCNEFIPKPFKRRELLKSVSKYL